MKAHIGISENHLQAIALELNKVLADEFISMQKPATTIGMLSINDFYPDYAETMRWAKNVAGQR